MRRFGVTASGRQFRRRIPSVHLHPGSRLPEGQTELAYSLSRTRTDHTTSPQMFWNYEEPNHEIACSECGSHPLVRYNNVASRRAQVATCLHGRVRGMTCRPFRLPVSVALDHLPHYPTHKPIGQRVDALFEGFEVATSPKVRVEVRRFSLESQILPTAPDPRPRRNSSFPTTKSKIRGGARIPGSSTTTSTRLSDPMPSDSPPLHPRVQVLRYSDLALKKSPDNVQKGSDPVQKSPDPVQKSPGRVQESSDAVQKASDPVEKTSDPVQKSSDRAEEH
ncbi:hypothetical protein F4780DRAFT_76041 [Xylariomycetidae sp. FL0641]|nr:hypothetical protein F4780DRAFT_76041 [Xylariomycetidae sp. FL0641]